MYDTINMRSINVLLVLFTFINRCSLTTGPVTLPT